MRSQPTASFTACPVHTACAPGRAPGRKQAARPTPLARALAAAWLMALPLALHAQTPQRHVVLPATLPSGLQIGAGQASVVTQGAHMTVRNSPGAILNWQGFSIGEQALVHFEQAGAASKVLNRVTGQDPSLILGSLTSNGAVWLLNPNGVLFGQGARVDVASLVASTLRLNDQDFLAGRHRFWAAGDAPGTVRNEGSLRSAFGGQIVLLGERVENSGTVSAPGGEATLAAARSVDLVDTGLPNLSVRVQLAAGESLNLGRLMADGGTVNVYGAIVNQQGLVQADTLGLDASGRIVLRAADTLTLGENSRTQALGLADGTQGGSVHLLGSQVGVLGQAVVDVSGAAGGGSVRLGGGLQGQDSSLPNARAVYLGPLATLRADATADQGSGGSIILWGDQATRAYGTLSAHGARLGGDGGFIETSGGWLDARPARVDVAAAAGYGGAPGTWLLDPNNILITSSGTDANISAGPNFTSTNDNSVISTATLATALNAGNSVSVVTAAAGSNAQAGDIVMDSATLIVTPSVPVTLTLSASRDVLVRNSTLTSTAAPLSLTLQSAGTGVGAIEISNTSMVTAGGSITLRGSLSQQVPLPGGGVSTQAFPVTVGYDAQLQPLPSQLSLPQTGVLLNLAQLNLGAGTFTAHGLGSLTAPNSLGVAMGPGSSITAAHIALSGWSPAFSAPGVTISGNGTGSASLTATQSLALQGGGLDGVRVQDGARLTLNAPGNPAASLSIDGAGTRLGVVVDDPSDSIPIATQITVVGGSFTLAGRSTDATTGATAVQITDSTGGGRPGALLELGGSASAQISGSALTSTAVGVEISNVNITGPASGATDVHSSSGGLTVSAVNFDAGSMTLRSDSTLNLTNSTLDTSGGLTLRAVGSAGGGGSPVLRVSGTALSAGGLLQINGQASDTSTGVSLLGGTYSGQQVSVIGTSSGGLGLSLVDEAGRPTVTATLAAVSLAGSSGGTGTGVSFTGNWDLQSPTDINILTEGGLPLLAGASSGLRPIFSAGQRFLLENFSPLGLVVGTGQALDGGLLSAALAGMPATATATLRATGSANPLTLRGPITVPSRLAIQADGIELQAGTVLTSSAPGDAIVLGGVATADAAFMLNSAGAAVLSTPNGRWVVRATDPGQTTLGGLVGDFTAYNLAALPWATDAAGNLVTPLPGNALGYAVATSVVAGQGLAGQQTRAYDTTTLLTLDPATWTLSGLVPGDSLVLSGVTAAQLADKNVGTAKPVTLDGGSLFTVNDALGRPVFGYGTPTFTANVTPVSLAISGATVGTKVYDSTVLASLASLGSVTPLAGDIVAVGGTVLASFTDKNVGFAKPVVASGFAPTGVDAGNYLLLPPTGLVGNVTPRTLALSGLVANNKVYDASAVAVLSGSATVNALAGDSVLTAGSASAIFSDKNVGNAKPVLVSGLGLAGTDASNYTLAPPVGLLADITPAPLAVTGLAGAARVYNGSTSAPLVGTAAVLPLSGDSVTLAGTATGSFATRNAGAARPISVLGLSLAGADAGNYNLLAPTGLVADITPAPLGLAGVTAANRAYDGSTAASVSATLAGQVAGDSVALALSNARFSDRNVGSGKVVLFSAALTGADAANYALSSGTSSTLANITRATLTYGATPVIGTVGLTLPPLSGQVSGLFSGDTLSSSTNGLLAWTTSATSAGPAGSYAINGSGLTALNYQFVQSSGNASALTLRAPETSDPASTATAVANTAALLSVQVPLAMSTPTEGRVLDTTTAFTPATATLDGVATRASARSGESGVPVPGSTAPAPTATGARVPGAGAATPGLAFAPLDLSNLPRDEVQTLLAARAKYKQSVFSRSVYRLQQDPSLADVRACRNESELSSGVCVITEFIKEQIQAARLSLASAAQPQRELQRRVKQAALPSIERKMALLIGVNQYDDKEVPQLLGAVPDARAVRDLLDRKLGYETTVLENPTRASIIRAFNQLALDAEPNDSVIVYYAGHGVVVPINGVETGFWLSSDVNSERPDTWLANADIARMIAAVGARQLMLVSDSCYSGALVGKDRVQVSAPDDAAAMLKRKAAVVMSSGGDEPVADQGRNGHSVFAWHFMRGLEGLDQWQVGGSIYERLRSAVFKDFPQTPQYGASRPAGHEGNTDFLFERRELEAAAPAVKTP